VPPTRRLENWLKGLQHYVEDTEAPRHFWLWGGIFTLCAALQRRVWLPYGIEILYPNIFVLIVAPPGGRKGGPVGFARKILREIGHNVSADSLSKRRLTRILCDISGKSYFEYKGKQVAQAPLAIVSKEMSSLLALDPKAMVEVLTDLFDSHDSWDYETDGAGSDLLRGVCVSCLAATTPTWLAGNLPIEAIGGGFTSRCVLVYGDRKYKEVPIPSEMDEQLYSNLCTDLNRIAMLKGEFHWAPGAEDFFKSWYGTIGEKTRQIKDARIHPFMSRIHIVVLKTAIALRVAYSDELLLTEDDLGRAIEIVESTLHDASTALGGHGRSQSAQDVEVVLRQIRISGEVSFTELLQMNYRNTSKTELEAILETITSMRVVKEIILSSGEKVYKWVGKT